jgi:hypothetical protein
MNPQEITTRATIEAVVNNLDLVDVWTNTPDRRTYTYYAVKAAYKKCRIDINRNFAEEKWERKLREPPSRFTWPWG